MEFKFYKSPLKSIKLILLCSIFVIPSIWMLISGDSNNWVAWTAILFFGLGYPIGLFNLVDRRPQIIINEIGVFDRTIHKDFINWELIKDAYPGNVNNQKFISLVIDEKFEPSRKKGKFIKLVSKLNKAMGFQELNLNLSQIKVDEVKLTEFIIKMSGAEKSERNNLLNALGAREFKN